MMKGFDFIHGVSLCLVGPRFYLLVLRDLAEVVGMGNIVFLSILALPFTPRNQGFSVFPQPSLQLPDY
jgi:hypothetical protein